MKRMIFAILTLVAVFFITSCNDDSAMDKEKTGVQLIIRTFTDDFKSQSNSQLVIDKFLMNIDKIEFELDDDWDDFDDPNNFFDDDEITIYGPFLIDLMSPEAFDGIKLGNVFIPNAVYEEIEVDIDISKDQSVPEIYNKSLYITGTINETPFIFWYDDDFDFEIEFDDGKYLELDGESVELMIQFYLPRLIDAMIDSGILNAKDGNGNGIIEIWEDDPDGNDDLADDIIDAIEDALDVEFDDD
ncbi:MAG: hypothetical protein EA393_13305 [Bacteroidetes bacterium]|nr:MAG: hypothetical protein EA393_13305 [Bacteroidota bacterium]